MLGTSSPATAENSACTRSFPVERAFDLDLSTSMRFRSGRVVPVRLKRLSAAAVVIESPELVVPGTEVEINLPAVGVRTAEVNWQVAGRLGGCLGELLKSSELFAARMTAFDQGRC